MTKPKFITVCQQAKKLLDMMPVVDEDIKYYIVNYREASEFFSQKECIGSYTISTRNIPKQHSLPIP